MTGEEIHRLMQEAIAHQNAGRLAQAGEIYGRILRDDPAHGEALHQMGLIAAELGRTDAAIQMIQRAVAAKPQVAVFWCNFGKCLADAGRWMEAADACREALRLSPELAEAWNNLGNALKGQGQPREAMIAYEQALGLKPTLLEARKNLAAALLSAGRIPEATAHYRSLAGARPDDSQAHCRLADALHDAWLESDDAHHFNEAQRHYQRAIALSPEYPDAHWNYAVMLLNNGNMEPGWAQLEWRCRAWAQERGFSQPHWTGTPAAGKTILLHTLGGFGDAIQFVRLAKPVREGPGAGARLILECDRSLVDLMRSAAGIDEVIARGDVPPRFDLHAPLQSLPGILDMRLENIPASVPYLGVPDEAKKRWKGKVERDGQLNVGLVWAGSFSDARLRSGSLELFGPFAGSGGVRFFSLQTGDAATQVRPPGLSLIDFSNEIRDFSDTAALIGQLDLVITVDTAVAHLAGALGKAVWVLIPRRNDFRWLRGRADSPWYPTMRLFRQSEVGEWRPVVEELHHALTEWLNCQTS